MSRKLKNIIDPSSITENMLEQETKSKVNRNSFEELQVAFNIVLKELQIEGKRTRTIKDYQYHFERFCEVSKIKSLSDINQLALMEYLAEGKVSPSTRAIRLKHLNAVFNRLYINGYLEGAPFWKRVKVKVPQKIKEGLTEDDVESFLSGLQYTTYQDLRDATAVLLMWETGVRIGTCSKLTETMIDFDNLMINFSGDVVKNGKNIFVPITSRLSKLLKALIHENHLLLNEQNKVSINVFLTEQGEPVLKESTTNNSLTKSIRKKARFLGMNNFQTHNLRRGMAKRLLSKGVDIATISKVLGHSDLSVTTQYLHIKDNEVIDTLRKFNV